MHQLLVLMDHSFNVVLDMFSLNILLRKRGTTGHLEKLKTELAVLFGRPVLEYSITSQNILDND
jgi:hypothetical protein